MSEDDGLPVYLRRSAKAEWDDVWLRTAEVAATRSGCERAQVGAVIVDAGNRIVATGYNGPPAHLRGRHKLGGRPVDATCEHDCLRNRKTPKPPVPVMAPANEQCGVGEPLELERPPGRGCLLPRGHAVGPWGHFDGEAWSSRPPMPELDPGYDDCISIHAEANALLFCDRRDREGGTLYVAGAICYNCAKLVANSGLARVVVRVDLTTEAHRNPKRTADFLRASGLRVVELPPEVPTCPPDFSERSR